MCKDINSLTHFKNEMSELSNFLLRNPKIIALDNMLTATERLTDAAFVTPSQLKQFVLEVPCKQRLVCLASFLRWKTNSM